MKDKTNAVMRNNEKNQTSKFQILLETVRIGSISKAANQMNYTQSGLTYLLNTIETELGFPVLSRTYSGVHFNQEGKALEPYIRALVEQEISIQSEIHRLRVRAKGKISIYTIHSVANMLLPELIAGFRKKQPNANIEIQVTSGSQIAYAIKSGLGDFGIVDEAHSEGLKWLPLFKDQFMAAIPDSWEFPPEREEIQVDELNDKTMLFPASNTKNVGAMLLKDKNISDKIFVAADDSVTLLNMVASGLGFAMVSQMYYKFLPAGIRLIHVNPPLYRPLGIVVAQERYMTPIAKEFVEYVRHINEQEHGSSAEQKLV